MAQGSSQKLSLNVATMIGLNTMIGAGIFTLPSKLGALAGPAGLITYILAFLAIWFIAQSFARAAYLFPQEGSFYIYAKQWGGHRMGLISAGAYMFGLLFAMGLLCQMTGNYLHSALGSSNPQTLGLIVLIAVVILNMLGAKLSKVGQYVLLVATIIPLAIIIAMCLSKANFANLFPFVPYGPFSILRGVKVVVFGFLGFECVASLFNSVENPEKNVPLSLQYALLITGLIYLVFLGSALLAIPGSLFIENPDLTMPQALQALFPENSAFIIAIVNFGIIIALIVTIHSMIWGLGALMLSYLKFLHNKTLQNYIRQGYITQNLTVLFCGIIVFTSFMTVNNTEIFFSLTNVGVVFAYICSIVSLLFIKKEWTSGRNTKTIIAIAAGLIIFGLAVESLIKNIIELF